jgi:hypothetical protein
MEQSVDRWNRHRSVVGRSSTLHSVPSVHCATGPAGSSSVVASTVASAVAPTATITTINHGLIGCPCGWVRPEDRVARRPEAAA